MDDPILAAWRMLNDGPPVLTPPGRVAQLMLPWDSPPYWDNMSGDYWYFWEFVPALLSGGPDIIRIKQTVMMNAVGPQQVKKHEAVLAVRSSDISDIGRMKFPGTDHGGSFTVQNFVGASTIHASVPAALTFSFKRPISLRRYREYPLFRNEEEGEVLVTEFPLWMPSQQMVVAVEPLVREWLNTPASGDLGQSSSMGSISMGLPSFGDFPLTPPGSVRRDF
jgi:hypothetical protein